MTDDMILEGLVTTLSPEGTAHLAAMGPRVEPEKMTRLWLRPYCSSQTFRNLQRHGEGVFHVTDDVLLLAQTVVGQLASLPPLYPAQKVRGFILSTACRYYEFRVCALDASQERALLEAEVVASGRFRDFLGFNRAKHAVVEAAILATRVHLLPREEIEAEYRRLAVLVDKTGGEAERQAFALLAAQVARQTQEPRS